MEIVIEQKTEGGDGGRKKIWVNDSGPHSSGEAIQTWKVSQKTRFPLWKSWKPPPLHFVAVMMLSLQVTIQSWKAWRKLNFLELQNPNVIAEEDDKISRFAEKCQSHNWQNVMTRKHLYFFSMLDRVVGWKVVRLLITFTSTPPICQNKKCLRFWNLM